MGSFEIKSGDSKFATRKQIQVEINWMSYYLNLSFRLRIINHYIGICHFKIFMPINY